MNKLNTVSGGRLIIFEGIDGIGKTTQLKLAESYLKEQGYKVKATRNLGGTPIGEELRQVILNPIKRPPLTDLFISMAIQEALLGEVEKLRRQGSIILMDRSHIAMVAYQAYGSGLNKAQCWKFADKGMQSLRPELTLYLSGDIAASLARAKVASGKADYFESKPETYFKAVNKGYEAASKRYQVVTINADRSIEAVHFDITKKISQII